MENEKQELNNADSNSATVAGYDFACGQKFYKIIGETVHRYEYLCKHPHNGHYHILLNLSTQEPERFYTLKMNELIDDKTKAYEILKQMLINRAETIQQRYLSKQ